MSWKKNHDSYVVKRPHLDEIIGNDNNELAQGLSIYHQWCRQLLTVRTTSVGITFFVFGIAGVYLTNLPLYLFSLNDIDYLSLSGLWTVTCIVMLWTTTLFVRSRSCFSSNQYTHPLNALSLKLHSKWWWTPLVWVIIYPLFALFSTSFYLSWIGLNFQSMFYFDGADPADFESLILNYSVLWLSYIYGFIPNVLCDGNTLYFKEVQTNRRIFVKQSLVRCLLANAVQTATFCLCTMTMWWVLHCTFWDLQLTAASFWRIGSILWRITWTLNWQWLTGDVLLNLLLTEKQDMSRFNGCVHPLVANQKGRHLDVRMMALTYSHLPTVNNEKEREYFFHLAQLNLLDVAQWDSKQRKLLYAQSAYFDLLLQTLLSQHTEFVTAVYQSLYGPDRRHRTDTERPLWTHCCGSYLYRTLALQPEMYRLFRNHQTLRRSADILSFLVVHSLEEDELGIVQNALEQILAVLLEELDILDIYLQSEVYRDTVGLRTRKSRPNAVVHSLSKGVETALMRIVQSMYSHLGSLKLPDKNAKRLQSYLR